MKQSKFYQIKNITEHEYTLVGCDGSIITRPIQEVDKTASAFTIQDAKDGDVLSDGTTIFIFKDLLSDNSVMSYCDYDTDSGESDAFCPLSVNLICSKITPATKEQRDFLFQKMKEAGYEWDAEKKELKKIVVPIFHIGDRVKYKGHKCDGVITEITDTDYICGNAKLPISTQDKLELVKLKPTWSEEDECCINQLIVFCENCMVQDSNTKKCATWLKSLRHQSHWKPSEEMLEALYKVIPENVMEKSEDEMLLDKLYQGLRYGKVLSEK